MRRHVASLFMLLLVGAPFLMAQGGGEAAGEAGEVLITLWTQEGEAEGAFQFVQTLAQEFSETHEGVTIEVLNKDTEALREDFQTASLAGAAPDLLWTVNDHAGPFVVADLIQPVENLVDLSKYVPSVEMKGHVWGVPISSGNHLMLLYNKDLVPNPPKTTDELIKIGSQLKAKGVIPLVFNQTEPFWLVPWLGGFGGKVFASDGVTPTLNTKEMVATLKFLHELKFTHGLLPPESDYDGADTLFKEGKAAMIINGDWSLSGYRDAMGEKLGVARIPKVSATGLWPAPYTSGKYFMIPKEVSGAKLSAVVEFIKYATNYDNQIRMVKTLSRLPGLKAALDDPLIKNDEILKASADQMAVGTPMPSVVEMRAVWDAMKPEMNAVLADQKTPEEAAAAMQGAAEAGIEALR
ncbi:extracellular solute-binding protein family 1 [Spirochaeta thermophila DSM 6578]|uniref:Extracellular solute-binding protein family 1 n=1 Tax=Winmispira thermophila (strain ATCC 700085 / DSM 6578 / Z-1203) TaxID=869211 RepID=G0GD21_WINT7|nr:extracellular solute-binding protein [Spirochaeta thermophila]AEJ61313.1 extracellular solute-binding protein family 1 [Spirochaeta thermophila DSM 6578]